MRVFGVGVFHFDLDIVVLPEDAPELPRAGDPQRDGRGPISQRDLLDHRQEPDFSAQRLLLRRTHLQHLVHLRNHRQVHRLALRPGLSTIAAKLDRLCRYSILLLRHDAPTLLQGRK